jgi:hypothetical protein
MKFLRKTYVIVFIALCILNCWTCSNEMKVKKITKNQNESKTEGKAESLVTVALQTKTETSMERFLREEEEVSFLNNI